MNWGSRILTLPQAQLFIPLTPFLPLNPIMHRIPSFKFNVTSSIPVLSPPYRTHFNICYISTFPPWAARPPFSIPRPPCSFFELELPPRFPRLPYTTLKYSEITPLPQEDPAFPGPTQKCPRHAPLIPSPLILGLSPLHTFPRFPRLHLSNTYSAFMHVLSHTYLYIPSE